MKQKTEISKNYRLNDIVLSLQEEVPALDRTGEETPGAVTQDFLFSAPYRVGEKALLARLDGFSGRVFFEAGFAEGTETMTEDRVRDYTLRYLRYNGYLGRRVSSSLGFFKEITPEPSPSSQPRLEASVEFIEVIPAIYSTPQPSLDGGLPLNAFEVKGRLTKSL